MSTAPQARKGEFTGRHMWLVMIGFFGVVIAVNLTMAIVSSTSWTGLVVQNSYVASQQFEEKRIAHEAQQAAGWQSSFTHAGGEVALRITDGDGEPVAIDEISVQLNRPVGGHDDQNLHLVRSADGGYHAQVTLPAGVWDALVTATTELGPFELHERFKVEEILP